MTWYSRDSVQGYDKIGLAAYDSQCLEIHQKSFVISVLKVKLLLLNRIPEFSIKQNVAEQTYLEKSYRSQNDLV